MSFEINSIDVGIKLSFKKANLLADDAETLLKYNGSLSHVLGLYSLAIEEYGKAKLLEEIKLKTPELNQKYRIQRSEYYKHESKLQKAFKFLPKKCTHVNISVVVKDNTSNKNQLLKFIQKLKIQY